jgi:hypothetical protein
MSLAFLLPERLERHALLHCRPAWRGGREDRPVREKRAGRGRGGRRSWWLVGVLCGDGRGRERRAAHHFVVVVGEGGGSLVFGRGRDRAREAVATAGVGSDEVGVVLLQDLTRALRERGEREVKGATRILALSMEPDGV